MFRQFAAAALVLAASSTLLAGCGKAAPGAVGMARTATTPVARAAKAKAEAPDAVVTRLAAAAIAKGLPKPHPVKPYNVNTSAIVVQADLTFTGDYDAYAPGTFFSFNGKFEGQLTADGQALKSFRIVSN